VIPYGKQNISENDINSVIEVLKSDFITQGPCISNFETKMCEYTGAKYSVAVNSATSALHIACLALGLEEGDYLWTSPNSFVASSNCALYCGAKVDFVDIDLENHNMSVDALEKKLKLAKENNKLPKIVIPVHFSGASCDMKGIYELSKEYGFSIIEDASHAVGGSYENSKIGSCEYSDITVFSFHPVKIITTAEGGLAFTNSDKLKDMMNLYRTHGVTKDSSKYTADFDGPWKYEQVGLGFNYRMTDLQAALGISQLERLDSFISRRRELVAYYNEKLSGINGLILPSSEQISNSSWHLYVVRIEDGSRRLEVFNKLREMNIGVNVHYIPIHLQPHYRELGFRKGDFPISEHYYEGCITLPMYPDLTFDQIDYISECLRKVLSI